MDSLENEQHKSRLQLFFIISLGAYFFWFSQMAPPPVQPQDIPENPIDSNDSVVTKEVDAILEVNKETVYLQN